jgi:hypothetical protein
MENIKTKDEARQYAIDWQNKMFGEGVSVSYSELSEQQAELQALAEKFDLIEEFKENGII